jgi:hypothetical protein
MIPHSHQAVASGSFSCRYKGVPEFISGVRIGMKYLFRPGFFQRMGVFFTVHGVMMG